jgi:hypothetical protein
MSSPRRPRRFVRESFWLAALAALVATASSPRPSAAQLLPLPLPPLLPGNEPPPNEPSPPPPDQPPQPAPDQPPQPAPDQPPQPPPDQPAPEQPPSSPPQPPPPPPPAEPSSPAGTARFEENDLALATEGPWERRGPEVAAFSGGTATSSAASQARATFTFTGSSVVWLGLKCDVCGIADVSIDGGPAISIDTGGSAAPGSRGLESEPVFSAARLAAGSHTLSITVTGATSTSGAHVVVDAFDVGGPEPDGGQQSPSPPAQAIVDDGGAGSGDALSLALLAASLLLRRRGLSRAEPKAIVSAD